MSPAAGDTAAPAAGTVMTRPMIGMLLRPISFAASPPSLPVAASRNGSLFTDRFDSNLHWYLPDYALVDDVDPGFAFAVRQTGQQANGQPFLVARLSLRLKKLQPGQVAQFAKSNPHAVLREIPLENPTAVLSSAYIDQQAAAHVPFVILARPGRRFLSARLRWPDPGRFGFGGLRGSAHAWQSGHRRERKFSMLVANAAAPTALSRPSRRDHARTPGLFGGGSPTAARDGRDGACACGSPACAPSSRALGSAARAPGDAACASGSAARASGSAARTYPDSTAVTAPAGLGGSQPPLQREPALRVCPETSCRIA
jgi:hypothetical protein